MSENFASGFLGWFLGSKSRRPTITPSDLDVGDSFYQVRPGNPEWVIDRICVKTSCDIPHVVITRKGNFPNTKVISAATLLDLNLYRHDRREPEVVNDVSEKRRKTDRKH